MELKRIILAASIVMAICLHAGAQEKNEPKLAPTVAEGKAFLADNSKRKGVTVTPSGLQYKVLKKGSGEKATNAADTVILNYKLTLIDGRTLYEVSNGPVWGSGALWHLQGGEREALLELMSEGSKLVLYLPDSLTHREDIPYLKKEYQGLKIPAASTLICEIELLRVKRAVKK